MTETELLITTFTCIIDTYRRGNPRNLKLPKASCRHNYWTNIKSYTCTAILYAVKRTYI